MIRALGRRRSRGDAGMTLAELSVGMFVTMLVVMLAAGIYIGITRDFRTTVQRVNEVGDARFTREAMAGTMRAADAVPPVTDDVATIVLDGQASDLTFTTSYRNVAAADTLVSMLNDQSPGSAWATQVDASKLVPRKVRYSYQTSVQMCGRGNGIVEQVYPLASVSWSPSAQLFSVTWSATAQSTRCLMRTSVRPDFLYYSECTLPAAAATPLPSATTAPASQLARPLTAATRNQVQAVEFKLLPGTSSEVLDRVCLVNSGTGATG